MSRRQGGIAVLSGLERVVVVERPDQVATFSRPHGSTGMEKSRWGREPRVWTKADEVVSTRGEHAQQEYHRQPAGSCGGGETFMVVLAPKMPS